MSNSFLYLPSSFSSKKVGRPSVAQTSSSKSVCKLPRSRIYSIDSWDNTLRIYSARLALENVVFKEPREMYLQVKSDLAELRSKSLIETIQFLILENEAEAVAVRNEIESLDIEGLNEKEISGISLRISQSRETFLNNCKKNGLLFFKIPLIENSSSHDITSLEAIDLAGSLADMDLIGNSHLEIFQRITSKSIFPKSGSSAVEFARSEKYFVLILYRSSSSVLAWAAVALFCLFEERQVKLNSRNISYHSSAVKRFTTLLKRQSKQKESISLEKLVEVSVQTVDDCEVDSESIIQ